MNKNIRLADLTEASKFMIGPFRLYIISGKPQNDYLYKTALSRRRLLRFHQPGDVVYAQTLESFLIKVFKSPRSHDFLRQIELDDKVTVDNMKKFQELTQQSTINEIANCPICKLLLVNPATIAPGKVPFRQLEG